MLYVKPDTPATCRASLSARRCTAHCVHKAQSGTVAQPFPHSHPLLVPRPGRWPSTNTCSSFWTSVGLAPVAYILARCISGSSGPVQLCSCDLACLPSLPRLSISIITRKIALKMCPEAGRSSRGKRPRASDAWDDK